MDPTRTRKSSWAGTTSLTCPISMPQFPGPPAVPARATASLKSARSGAEPMDARETGGAVDAHGTAEAVARRSYGKLVAFLAAQTHDVAAAEDALSEAFAAALADWPA